jgi:phage terminase small subunit
MSLTPKQEKFSLTYFETGNASEAYRTAYLCKNMSDRAIAVEASRLLNNPKITLRIDELGERQLKRHDTTIDSLTKELDELRQRALKEGQISAGVSAVMGKAKLHGLIRDKSEVNLNVTHEEALAQLDD